VPVEAIMPPYRIILAEDHILLRQAVKKIIEETPGLTVIGEAGDGLELLELLEGSLPDMVITDIAMPRLRGLVATMRIKELHPQIKVLILTVYREKGYVDQAMKYGAEGYLLKEELDHELLPATLVRLSCPIHLHFTQPKQGRFPRGPYHTYPEKTVIFIKIISKSLVWC
jgi:DNA-binding NarL/FixJ family response regulator